MYVPSLYALLAFGLAQWAHAQSSTVVSVYVLDMVDRPAVSDGSDPSWSGAVLEAVPEATTYRIEHKPYSAIGENVSVLTLVNGPSTYANWRVHDSSSTYGEYCSLTSDVDTFSCNVTYLGAFGRGGSMTTTSLETASHTYSEEDRTFAAVPVTITDGPELESTMTAPPGEQEAAAATASDGAAESGEAAEAGADVVGGAGGPGGLVMAAAVGAVVAL